MRSLEPARATSSISYSNNLDDRNSGDSFPLRFINPSFNNNQNNNNRLAQQGSRVVLECEFEIDINNLNSYLFKNLQINWLFKSDLPAIDSSSSSHEFNIINEEEEKEEEDYVITKKNENKLIIKTFDATLHSGLYRCLLNNTLNNIHLLSPILNLSLACKYRLLNLIL